MKENNSKETLESIINQYEEQNPTSKRMFLKACEYLPGGNTRQTIFYQPYPVFMERGEGSRLYDVDGNERIDFSSNYTGLILGHQNPLTNQSLSEQMKKGLVLGAPTANEAILAEIICSRVASVKRVRFVNSGTEACMNAVRAARAFTGRPKIGKFEGGFHGSSEHMEMSITPGLDQMGPKECPVGVPSSPGIPEGVMKDVVILPYNDLTNTEKIIKDNRDVLAGVIVEPCLGVAGVIPAEKSFLEGLRRITGENGVLLIFDEVMTFRISRGGAQEYYGVEPDLTTFGKLIGGGLPVGAFGGREDIMSQFDGSKHTPIIRQSGTYSGNPFTLAAGISVLKQLTPEAYSHLNSLGDYVRRGLQASINKLGIEAQITGIGSLFSFHFTQQKVVDYRSAASSNKKLTQMFHLGLMNCGIFMTSRGFGCISVPMTKGDVQDLIDKLEKIAQRIF